MSKSNRLFLWLIPLWLAALSPMAGFAADEDIISQVYLEFDPETGEFKTAQDPSLSNSSRHQQAQQQQIQQIQQKQDELVGGTASQPNTAAAPAGQGGTVATADGEDAAPAASNSTLWAGGILVIGLVGGALLLVRKNQQKTAS